MSETTLERWKRAKPHFICPRCDAISWNPTDIAERYCGRCHVFFAPPTAWPLPRPQLAAVAPMPRKRRIEPARPTRQTDARRDDDNNPLPTFPTFSTPDPPSPPDPPAFDPGGGSSGGGGASGDF